MQIFVYIFAATVILVAVTATIPRKKNLGRYWMPGVVLTSISLIIAVVSYFTLNGWGSMGFFFLFISVAIGSGIGTVISSFQNLTSS